MFDIFFICHSVLNSSFVNAGTLSRVVYTYESGNLSNYTNWIVVFS